MWYNDVMYKVDKLVKLRKEKNLKLKDLARIIDTSIAYYHMIETGKRKLYYDDAVKIANYFNMKPDELFLD